MDSLVQLELCLIEERRIALRALRVAGMVPEVDGQCLGGRELERTRRTLVRLGGMLVEDMLVVRCLVVERDRAEAALDQDVSGARRRHGGCGWGDGTGGRIRCRCRRSRRDIWMALVSTVLNQGRLVLQYSLAGSALGHVEREDGSARESELDRA